MHLLGGEEASINPLRVTRLAVLNTYDFTAS
jgi:hypothetical protein